MNEKKESITYPWSEENIDAFDSSLNTAIHYSEKQGNIYLPLIIRFISCSILRFSKG